MFIDPCVLGVDTSFIIAIDINIDIFRWQLFYFTDIIEPNGRVCFKQFSLDVTIFFYFIFPKTNPNLHVYIRVKV
jgi:hypothetical protein